MKNSNEMFNSLLERRDRYLAGQRRKRRAVIRAAACACSLCLVVLLVGLWQSGLPGRPDAPLPGDTPGEAGGPVDSAPVPQGQSSPSKEEYPAHTDRESWGGGTDLSPANTKDATILVNELASELPQESFYALRPEDYCEYTKDELFAYYGVAFDLSSIFPDMVERNTDSYGIFRSGDGIDLMGHCFVWADPSGDEEVSIQMRKGGTPKTDVNDIIAGAAIPLASTISGETVKIFHSDVGDRGGYYAEFFHKGLGFAVYGYNFDEEDFVRVLSYLISC